MQKFARNCLKIRRILAWVGGSAVFLVLGLALVSCGGGTSGTGSGNGSITVNLSDPPSCAFPNGPLTHVWVTINSVQANTSSTAGDGSPGWVELTPQLKSSPMSIDLF